MADFNVSFLDFSNRKSNRKSMKGAFYLLLFLFHFYFSTNTLLTLSFKVQVLPCIYSKVFFLFNENMPEIQVGDLIKLKI